jgi:hypothetical protein
MIVFLALCSAFSFACNDMLQPNVEIIKHKFGLENEKPHLYLCYIKKTDERDKAYFRYADAQDPQSFCYLDPGDSDVESSDFLKEKSLFFCLTKEHSSLLVLNLKDSKPKICRLETVIYDGCISREIFFINGTFFLSLLKSVDKKQGYLSSTCIFVLKFSLNGSLGGYSTEEIVQLQDSDPLSKKDIEKRVAKRSFKQENMHVYDEMSENEYTWKDLWGEYFNKKTARLLN